MVQELISGRVAAADAAAAAAVAADSEAARRKERAEHKKQRKRHRDRGSHNKRTNARKNVRRSEGRKVRARTRAQMAPVLSQLLHRSRSRQASEVVGPRLITQACPPLTYIAQYRPVELYIRATNELGPFHSLYQVSVTPLIFSQSKLVGQEIATVQHDLTPKEAIEVLKGRIYCPSRRVHSHSRAFCFAAPAQPRACVRRTLKRISRTRGARRCRG